MIYEREFISPDEWDRRFKQLDAFAEWLTWLKPNFFVTLTFNDISAAEAKISPFKGPKDITAEEAHRKLYQFYNRVLRKLLGPRYSEKKDQQPIGIAFLEYASLKGNPKRKRYNPQNSPHFHILWSVPDDLIENFRSLDIEEIWVKMNPSIHRTAHVGDDVNEQTIARCVTYVTKQYTRSPTGLEYQILGMGSIDYGNIRCQDDRSSDTLKV